MKSVSESANRCEPEITNLLGMDRQALELFFTRLGEKPFRATQLMKWIHQGGVTNFSDMTNLSKALRTQLQDIAEVRPLEVTHEVLSEDGTRKWLMKLDDGNSIETVYIPEDDRGTLCVSSQIGCALDCSFCSTGRQGFNRNLSGAEIVSQLWTAEQMINEKLRTKAVTNVVLMGMGEPLLNFDNVVSSIRVMMDDFAYGLSKRRVTISTAGVVPALDRVSEILDMRLAVSLHAANDELRDQLVPLNKKYPLSELMAACRRFISRQTNRSRITFEYVMLKQVNDSDGQARELARLLEGIPSMVNLIPFNNFQESGYETTPMKQVRNFCNILQQAGITAVIRKTRGDDIDAACGQLVGKVTDKSRRFRRFQSPRFGMSL